MLQQPQQGLAGGGKGKLDAVQIASAAVLCRVKQGPVKARSCLPDNVAVAYRAT